MKVLLVHCHYQIRGGEDTIFASERDMLRAAGVEVVCFEKSNADFSRSGGRLSLFLRTVWNRAVYREMLETLAREYNGIGPAFFPEKLREKTTKFLSLFEPAALIHDLRNFESDGSEEKFHLANAEFLANCRRCVEDKYAWWNLKRYRGNAVANLLYEFVDGPAGWKAWMDCYEKNQKGNNR